MMIIIAFRWGSEIKGQLVISDSLDLTQLSLSTFITRRRRVEHFLTHSIELEKRCNCNLCEQNQSHLVRLFCCVYMCFCVVVLVFQHQNLINQIVFCLCFGSSIKYDQSKSPCPPFSFLWQQSDEPVASLCSPGEHQVRGRRR